VQLSGDQDPEELREFIQHIENSDEPADPGTTATGRMARALLEQNTEKVKNRQISPRSDL
jgi:hypothetical protein